MMLTNFVGREEPLPSLPSLSLRQPCYAGLPLPKYRYTITSKLFIVNFSIKLNICMKNIVFFGDSFAAHGANATDHKQMPTRHTDLVSYIDIVAEAQQAQPVYMGFSGSSWWYSYLKFAQWIAAYPQMWHETQAVVMCLTASGRPKISRYQDLIAFDADDDLRRSHYKVQALTQGFDQWAYRHFLHEAEQQFRGKKVILLPCFSDVTWISKEMREYFATSAVSLCTISHSEFKADAKIRNKDDITKLLMGYRDSRANHLSQHNNYILAQDIIAKLDNYAPGVFMLNQSAYERGNNFYQNEYDEAQAMYQTCSTLTPDFSRNFIPASSR